MAKRFTDTDKWKREWFCQLDPKAKLVWFYILDQCDHRGVWFRNFKLMSEQVGFKVSAELLNRWFGDKIRPFDGDKYFISSFVSFQYGKLNPSNNAHKPVIELVEYLEKLAPHEPQNSPSLGAQDKDKDKEQDKVSVLKGGLGENKIPGRDEYPPEFQEFWKAYPRRADKSVAFKAFAKNVQLPEEAQDVLKAANNFAAVMTREKRESRHIRLPATFLNDRKWRDYIEADLGASGTKNYANERETDHDAEIAEAWGA